MRTDRLFSGEVERAMNKKLWPILLVLAGLTACAGSSAFRDAKEEEALKHWDLAVLKYSRAAELDPKRTQYKISLARAKMKASQFHFEKGKLYRASSRPELAVVELEQAVILDPTNQYAESELRKARDEAARVIAERTGDTRLEALKKKERGARARAPMLEPTSDHPINLNFPQPKPIKQIYQSLAAAAGINVIFDPQLKDENVSIVLNNISFQNALETLMRQENHFYKVIDEHTFLIAADTPQNRKTYEDLVLRTFYLSNGDITDVSNALRSLLQTTRIYPNKAENSITIRDTADKVAIAERIIEQNDKQLAEVVVDVELLQINTTKSSDIGLLLTPYATTATAPAPGGNTDLGAALPTGTFSWDQLRQLSIHSFGFTLPTLTYSLIKNNTDAELLAKPQLRISEGQKAQLVIGDQVPIPTTTFNTGTTVGGNIVPVTSFQYRDVGIKIEVEPRVHHNKEVTLKLTIEVSNLNGSVEIQAGQKQPIIGTRTISSNIRLKDGETNFLAGLLRNDRSSSTNKIPFLGDIPVIGRAFSKKSNDNTNTDLVLTLTPHIIRIPDITEEDLTPLYVGTDSNISFQGSPRIETPGVPGPFDFNRREPQPRPQPGQPAVAPPSNLVPGGMPTDLFRPPGQSVPPQPTPVPVRPFGAQTATPLTFDFDPSTLAIAPGQQVSVIVRANGNDTLGETPLVVRFDPAVVSAVAARPILSGSAVADSQVEPGRAVVQLPGGITVSGSTPVAEVVFRGVAAGRSALTIEKPAGGSFATVEVRKP
jgi:general secretion pathway protein D